MLRRRNRLVGICGLLACLATPAFADQHQEVPPPPPPPTELPPAGTPAAPPVYVPPEYVPPEYAPPTIIQDPTIDAILEGDGSVQIPDVQLNNPTPKSAQRQRPPEPPPPGVKLPGWDVDHLSPDQDFPAALPRPDPFPLRPILFRHDERVGSVDGRRTPMKRIPQWVDVIERRELQEWRPYDIGYLARRSPNVTVGDGGNPFLQLPSIRGLGGDRVKILTDGVWPASQSLGLQGGTLSLWDPEATERVEIYHGPGTYLRAIDSPGGMINIVPRRPRMHGAFSGDMGVRSSYDSATNSFRNRLEVDVGEGRVAALAGVTYTTVDNRQTATSTLNPSDYDQVSADFALDYFITPQSRVGLTGQYVKADNISAPGATGTAFADPSYERVFVAVTFSAFEIGDVFHGQQVSLALDSILQDDDRSITGNNAGIGSADDVTRFNFNLKGQLQLMCGHETWAELSVAYSHLRRTETLLCIPTPGQNPNGGNPAGGNPAPDLGAISESPVTQAEIDNCTPVTRSFEAEELFISALIEDQVHCECFDQYLGFRVDYWHVDDTRFNNNEGRLLVGGAGGYAKHFDKRISAYANASAGWRRPSIFERTATEIVDGLTVFGNENLDPEFHGNAEVGLKSSFRNRLSLQATLFGHYIAETIAPQTLAGGTSQALVNAGDVLTYGGELAAAWRPWSTKEGTELFTTLGVTRSTDTSLVANVPFKYRVGGRYSVPAPRGWHVRRWIAELAAHGATQSRDGPRGGSSYLTADFLVGMGVHFAPGRTGTINMGITNLLDEAYTPPGAVLPARGLSFFAGLELDF